MATVTVKHVPEELHRGLKDRASRNRRSLNSEILACLEEAMGLRPFHVDELLGEVQRLRREVSGSLDDALLAELIDEGRR